jgi:hypothetical protein
MVLDLIEVETHLESVRFKSFYSLTPIVFLGYYFWK